MPVSLKKYILWFIPFFLLFYSEGMAIGGMTVSQLWKLPLTAFLIYYVFQYRHRLTPIWAQIQYWTSLKCLFNAGLIGDLMTNFQYGIKFLLLPLLYSSAITLNRKKHQYETFLLVICQYFILTNVPFFLGLKTLNTGVDYGGFTAFSGIFQNQHAMSVIMAICIVVILHFYKHDYFMTFFSKLYNIALILVSSYAMYLGFARTGWLMCILAIVILFWPKTLSVKQWGGVFLVCLSILVGFIYLMNTNQNFHDRIVGNDLVTHKKINIDSGRSEYGAIALQRYADGSLFELVFGMSTKSETEAIFKKTHMHIGAHNGFIDMLARNGIIGLLMMVVFLISLLIFIRKRSDCLCYRLALAMWMMNFSFQVTQGGQMFHSDLLYALIFCIIELEHIELTPIK